METKADLIAIRISFISFDEVFVYHYVSGSKEGECVCYGVSALNGNKTVSREAIPTDLLQQYCKRYDGKTCFEQYK